MRYRWLIIPTTTVLWVQPVWLQLCMLHNCCSYTGVFQTSHTSALSGLSVSLIKLDYILFCIHGRLQLFVDAIVEHFLEKAPDLMSREYEREGVKLHATVMNSKFPYTEKKESVTGGGYRGSRPRDSFDAKGVFRVSIVTFHIQPMSSI